MHRFARRAGASLVREPWLWLLGCLLFLPSCYPGGAEDVTELDLVLTNFDDGFAFAQHANYAIPDTVAHIYDPDDPNSIRLSYQYDQFILDTINAKLQARGYTRVPQASAQVLVNVTAVGTQNWSIYYYYAYWGYYPGWPYYGYYPGYCCTTVVSYDVGTLLVEMVDPNNPGPDQRLPSAWNMAMYGVLGAKSGVQARLEKGIDQAFTQSPYLTIQ